MYGHLIADHFEITAVIARCRPRVVGRIGSPVPRSVRVSRPVVHQQVCGCECEAEDGSAHRQDCAVNIQKAISLAVAESVRESPPASDMRASPGTLLEIVSGAANVRA